MNQLHVLLAEDDADDKEFFMEALRRLGLPHEVSWAKNTIELFRLMEEKEFDLVILDINMPGINGKDCLHAMKAQAGLRSVPVIVMTVSKNTKDIDEVYEAGAHYYVIKPYSQVNNLETVRKIFSIDWKTPQPIPAKKDFLINLAFV